MFSRTKTKMAKAKKKNVAKKQTSQKKSAKIVLRKKKVVHLINTFLILFWFGLVCSSFVIQCNVTFLKLIFD